ncbi:MAG: hypothetical protein K6A68_01665 [Clostridiales bacterium]|nr:hypothetical protein [Clostridiales bacterium]
MEKKFNRFSVPLGLLDYVNPILYSITMVILIRNLYTVMEHPFQIVFLIGTVLSIVFGLIIPTGKVLVGLGVIRFRMPVALVFCVNTGILISGLMLLKHVMSLSLPFLVCLMAVLFVLLVLTYAKSRKINTIAVLTGAAGYLMIYVSLITVSVRKPVAGPVALYAAAILLFVMLCGIGIRGNLKNPRIHWVIEISNVLCQLLVAISTMLLFS